VFDCERGGEADAFVVGEDVGAADVEVGEDGVQVGAGGVGGVVSGEGDAGVAGAADVWGDDGVLGWRSVSEWLELVCIFDAQF